MLKKLLTYGNTFCAVEHTANNSIEAFNLLKLKKEKKELKIIDNKQLESIDSVFSNLKKQQHIFLTINNQHVLFKHITGTFNADELIVKNAFPSIKISEFYYQIVSTTQKHFVAICRKKYVRSLIDQYQSNNISVIDFSLHNLAISTLNPFLDQESIWSSNAEIILNNSIIEDIQNKDVAEKKYTINNLSISNNFVLSLAGILTYYLKATNIKGNYIEFKNSLYQLYFNKRFYYLGLRGALSILFLVLLINFVIFSSLRKKASSLNNEILVKSNQKNALLNIKNRVDKKTKLVNSIYALSDAKTSSLINYIGESVPSKLQLTKLEFQPIKNSIKENKEIIVLNNKINIKGISKSNKLFTNWISDLELKDWVQKVVVVNYGKGKSTTAQFEFEITIKN
jgi:Tfp pilus assembly protein PilN